MAARDRRDLRQSLPMDSSNQEPRILPAARKYWKGRAAEAGSLAATRDLLTSLWEFLRNSTPSRLRQLYGDAEYDWDYRVNTTSGAVGWRERLLGIFHSPYQPTEPALFREMLDSLHGLTALNFGELTFVDLGSGKGRTLLMAADYPFRRVVGVELLPALNQIAQQNLARYQSDSQKCFALETICADATTFPLPAGPLVIYLFNPFPETGLRRTLANLEKTLQESPRPAFVIYHNPQLEHVLTESAVLQKIGGTHQYSISRAG